MPNGSWYRTRPDSNREARQRWLLALLLAIGAQIPLIYGIYYAISHSSTQIDFKTPKKKEVELEWAEEEPSKASAMAEATEAVIRDPAEAPDKEQVPQTPDIVPGGTERPAGQIVSIAPPERQEMPEKGYAGQFASKVAVEQKATPTKDQTPKRPSPAEVRPRSPSVARGNPNAMEKPNPDTRPDEDPLNGSAPGSKSAQDSANRGIDKPGPDGVSLFDLPRPGLDPTLKYEVPKGLFGSDDYLPQVEKGGDSDLLNTIPYRYYGFFERVKSRVRQHWDPNSAYGLRDPTGQLYPRRDRLTVLSVTLDDRGYLVDARVVEESGLKFLDDEALRAMRAASPFLNPPKELVGSDGRIRFDFGFAFLTSSSPGLWWRF